MRRHFLDPLMGRPFAVEPDRLKPVERLIRSEAVGELAIEEYSSAVCMNEKERGLGAFRLDRDQRIRPACASPSPLIIEAICSIVGDWKIAASGMFVPNALVISAKRRTARSECPPRSKKLSVTPIGLIPMTFSQICASCISISSRGAT